MARECAEHFVDGKRAWELGFIGFFSKLRGLYATALVTVATMGVPWWWPQLPSSIEEAKGMFALAVLGVGGSSLVGLTYLRRRSIRSLEVKAVLHWMAHDLRDQLVRHASQADARVGRKTLADALLRDLAETSNRISQYFRLHLRDDGIGAVIRLAVKRPGVESLVYRTYARSQNLNPNRSKTSLDLKPDEGLVRFLAEKGNRGIVIYHDLDAAAAKNLIVLGRNHSLFRHEIRSMMIAPINGWDGEQQAMLGILYVTSRRSSHFSPVLTDSLLFVADAVASALSAILIVHAAHQQNRIGR